MAHGFTLKSVGVQIAPLHTAEAFFTQGIFASVDWGDTYKRVCVLAYLAAKSLPDIFDGVSIEDVVHRVFVDFFESPTQLGWDPNKGELSRFLMGVLKHKIADHCDRERKSAGSLDDPDFTLPISKISVLPHSLNPIAEVIGDDQPLQELVSAAERITPGGNRNQLLADELNTSSADIVNRKKRFKRILQKAKLAGEI
jgi:DNA-directed RNA polymerase specialized sigma24 family protein